MQTLLDADVCAVMSWNLTGAAEICTGSSLCALGLSLKVGWGVLAM